MENLAEKFKHIKGWGIDADPRNEPTYPMKKYTGDDHKRLNWDRPTLQEKGDLEVLHSNERPSISAVFGTSVPPKGISGMLRRMAFNFSEGSFGHWLPLILADRINVVEGILWDIVRGHVPDITTERGWKAEMKFNKEKFLTKVAVRAAIAGVVIAFLMSSKQKKKRKKYSY